MTTTLTKPSTKESKILHNLNDGVELSIKLFNEANDSQDRKERREKMRYLGMCLRSIKHGINIGPNTTQEP